MTIAARDFASGNEVKANKSGDFRLWHLLRHADGL
jgi:hypothetical protein